MYYLGSIEFHNLESAMIYHMTHYVKEHKTIIDEYGNIISRDICTGNPNISNSNFLLSASILIISNFFISISLLSL